MVFRQNIDRINKHLCPLGQSGICDRSAPLLRSYRAPGPERNIPRLTGSQDPLLHVRPCFVGRVPGDGIRQVEDLCRGREIAGQDGRWGMQGANEQHGGIPVIITIISVAPSSILPRFRTMVAPTDSLPGEGSP
jgi:hypothetical protein